MNTKLNQRRQFIKLASGLMVTPFASLTGGIASAQARTAPLRLLTIVESYGVPRAPRKDIWIDSTAGDYALTGDELGTILAPLRAYKDNMLVCTGNKMESVKTLGTSRTHHHMATHTLCGSSHTSGANASAKTEHASLDFYIGDYLNNEHGQSLGRAFQHLYFSTNSQAQDTTYCYDASGNQIRSLAGPIQQANAIFTDDASVAGLQFENDTQQSIFSLVQRQVQSLRGQLNGLNANAVMDAYQSSIDDLAAQIQLRSENVCGLPGNFGSYPTDLKQSTVSTPFIFNNIKQAFACDLASSITFVIGGEKINQLKHADLYDAEEHADSEVQSLLKKVQHSMSHQVSEAADKAHEVVRIHQSAELAKILDDMSVTPDVDGNTLLDNTVVFVTSAMSSNTHSDDDYCQLLIAGKNTNLKGGYHYDLSGHSHNELLTTIAQGMGMPDDRFGGHNRNGVYVNNLSNGPISRMLIS